MIYEQHRKAFAQVEAFVVLKDGERVATIAFKFPADGAGRLYAYVHWIGLEMVRGFAGGGGYDKRTAACADAVTRVKIPSDWPTTVTRDPAQSFVAEFLDAMRRDSGPTWDRALVDAGFTVLQAV